MSLITSLLTTGSNTHLESSENANGVATDFVSAGVVGSLGNTSGVAPMTGGYAVNAQGTPDMTVAVSTGVCYVTATPSSQNSQKLRVRNTVSTNVTISANASGSTKYDWLYVSISASLAANPDVNATTVATLTTSRSSSNTVDNGTPPTYGTLIAIITVANGASSITNSAIADSRTQSVTTSSTTTLASAIVYDHVNSGCVWTADAAGSTLLGSMTAGVVYISGVAVIVAAISGHAFTASKDTYVDVDSSGNITYTEVTNNAASPALSTGRVRLAIVVTGATNIAASTSINQGQETRILPIASSIPYAVTDSLGNLICPRDPNRKLLGYRQILTTFSTSTTANAVQVTGLSCPVIVPTGRKVTITFVSGQSVSNSVAGDASACSIWDGTVASGTQLQNKVAFSTGANHQETCDLSATVTPSTSSKTYNAGFSAITGGTSSVNGSSTSPAFIKVELV